MQKVHKKECTIKCKKCSKVFEMVGDLEEHLQTNHESTKLPASKKLKISDNLSENGDDSVKEGKDRIVMSDESNEEFSQKKETQLEELEKKSFEEERMNHREIEVQINEEEVENMGELKENEKSEKMIEKLRIKNESQQARQN